MNLGHYRIDKQLAAGVDGVAYRAEVDGQTVEVRDLRAVRTDLLRWPALAKRIRMAALVDHPSALKILAFEEDSDPPLLVVEASDRRPLVTVFDDRVPVSEILAVGLVRSLAGAVSAAHRVGLTHGAIDLKSVYLGSKELPHLDFTGVNLGEPFATGGESSADIRGLGVVFLWLLAGRDVSETPLSQSDPNSEATLADEPDLEVSVSLDRLVRAMLSENSSRRPTAREVVAILDRIMTLLASAIGSATIDHVEQEPSSAASHSTFAARQGDLTGLERLGRYRLREKLGQGGMGAVYRGEDLADGTEVALKVLKGEWASRPGAMRRFRKEARLLGEVNNPYVTNLLEINEDDGIHFIVLEFVRGQSLGQVLTSNPFMNEVEALTILSDVARALVDAHERGIVHRDIKPDNILLEDGDSQARRVKLSDFGLARHIEESESLQVTQDRAVVGTPQYMSPEQGRGGAIDARTDIYAMGITLFRMLGGQVPFAANGLMEVIAQHCNDPPPSLQGLNPKVSDGACRIVAKALAKAPEARYPDAAAILSDLDRLLRGELTPESSHPKLPSENEKEVLKFDFTWDLEASPRQLWPLVTNTERLNHAIGLPPVVFRLETDAETGQVRRFGEAKQGGIAAEWEEHPFEWVEPRRMGVFREYRKGPFKWMVSALELTPRANGGTTLKHKVRICARGAIMRAAANLKVGRDSKKALERVYRRIDATLTGKLSGIGSADPFEMAPPLPTSKKRRLERLLDGLGQKGISHNVVEALGAFIESAPSQEVTRIRPLALARRLGLDANQVTSACLHGARDGLFVLLWDILCPLCRVPSEVKDTLKSLRDHGHCDACQLDYDLDFANSVEMIFRVHPEVRDADLGIYCIGGPAHSPHVVAQVRVGAGERVELDLGLSEGSYQIRGPRLPFAYQFRVESSTGPRRLELNLHTGPAEDLPRVLRVGGQSLLLHNDFEEEIVIRVERTASRDDALTAARGSSLALFRELFPGEILTPGQLISIATTTLLQTEIEDAEALYTDLGDAGAFSAIHGHVRILEERIRKGGGALVKTVNEGILAAFNEPAAAVRVGLDLNDLMQSSEVTRQLRIRASVHRGPAMAATINDHLDYFGITIAQVAALLRQATPGALVLSAHVASDPAVMAVIRARGRESEILSADLPGAKATIIHRLGMEVAKSSAL
jgi:serine/threonine protein kinase/class 3 adenylate cyclase